MIFISHYWESMLRYLHADINRNQFRSKASLRVRLFCMMKHMHQYKQKKMKIFWVCSKNTFLSSVPYLNLLKSRFNHCPDSAIQECITLSTHTRFADLCVKLAQCVGILYWKAWRGRVKHTGAQTHDLFLFLFFFPSDVFFLLFPSRS